MESRIPRVRKLGEPIYEIIPKEVNGLTLFVAREVDDHYRQKAIYPVSDLWHLGHTRMLWIDVGPAGIISHYDRDSIDNIIFEVENLPVGSHTGIDPREDFINGFSVGSTTGNRRSYEFEFPLQFYKVNLNRELDFLKYERLEKLIDRINPFGEVENESRA